MEIVETTSGDINTRTAQLVQLISEIGPDIPEISRRLGQFKESVRYRYKEKILGRGFSVQASVDHEKLGLRRVLMILDFAPEYKTYANTILTAMNELCYVVSFEKKMFRGDYFVEASVPNELVQPFKEFMEKLHERGLFSALQVDTFDWFRTMPMRTEFYDFDSGRWDFDWSSPLTQSGDASYSPSEKMKFDVEDILILKELQIDATRSFVEIAEKLKMNYKKLAWHYNAHVIQRKMINGYYLRWMGTNYSTVLEKALHRKHRYHQLAILAKNLTEVERMNLMGKLHMVPFLWNEMVGEEQYCAQFFFPTEYITEAYQFLTGATSVIRDKVHVMPLDQTEALSFTFSYQLYDSMERKWVFEEQELLGKFETLFAKIKELGGAAV
jgi:hypothetical protein